MIINIRDRVMILCKGDGRSVKMAGEGKRKGAGHLLNRRFLYPVFYTRVESSRELIDMIGDCAGNAIQDWKGIFRRGAL